MEELNILSPAEFIIKYWPQIIFLLAFFWSIWRFIYQRRKKLRNLFRFRGCVCRLKHQEIFGDARHYHKYYKTRSEDELLREKLRNNQNVLITGIPLMGKTRSAYQALKSVKKWSRIFIPHNQDVDIERFIMPHKFNRWRTWILFFDDIEKFADKKNIEHLAHTFTLKHNTLILATCRSGDEKKKTGPVVPGSWRSYCFTKNI